MNPLSKKFEGTRNCLGSNFTSPRRQGLLKQLGLTFDVLVHEVDESYPEQFRREDIAMFLARKKALAFKGDVADRRNRDHCRHYCCFRRAHSWQAKRSY